MAECEIFYTARPIERRVTKKEFDSFIAAYPRELVQHCSPIPEPPYISFNDFALADQWPYSVVARTWLYSDDPADRYYTPEADRGYYIVVNYEELFKSKIGCEG